MVSNFQQYVSYIVADSFIGGGNRITRRKAPICLKSLKNFIIYCCIDRVHLATNGVRINSFSGDIHLLHR